MGAISLFSLSYVEQVSRIDQGRGAEQMGNLPFKHSYLSRIRHDRTWRSQVLELMKLKGREVCLVSR